MKRILHVVGKMNRAGAETMIMNIYRNIDKQKVQFDFLYFTQEKTSYDEEIINLGGHIYRLNGSNFISNIFQLRNLLKSEPEIEAIHCHTALSSFAYLFSAYISGVRQRFIHSHSSKSRDQNNFLYTIYEKSAKWLINKYATDFISCGRLASEYLFPYKDESQISVINNAIDVVKFESSAKTHKNYLRQQYSLSDNFIILLQIGRFSSVKNHQFSVQIAKQLLGSRVFFKIFFAGIGELQKEIEEMVRLEGLEDHIVFLGERSDIENLMAGSDIMLMPSIHEGFPMVLVEAQASGLHCIVSENISKEVDLNVGLLEFKKLNINDWAVSVQNFKNSTELSDGERLERMINQGFDINQSAEKLLELYEA